MNLLRGRGGAERRNGINIMSKMKPAQATKPKTAAPIVFGPDHAQVDNLGQ